METAMLGVKGHPELCWVVNGQHETLFQKKKKE